MDGRFVRGRTTGRSPISSTPALGQVQHGRTFRSSFSTPGASVRGGLFPGGDLASGHGGVYGPQRGLGGEARRRGTDEPRGPQRQTRGQANAWATPRVPTLGRGFAFRVCVMVTHASCRAGPDGLRRSVLAGPLLFGRRRPAAVPGSKPRRRGGGPSLNTQLRRCLTGREPSDSGAPSFGLKGSGRSSRPAHALFGPPRRV